MTDFAEKPMPLKTEADATTSAVQEIRSALPRKIWKSVQLLSTDDMQQGFLRLAVRYAGAKRSQVSRPPRDHDRSRYGTLFAPEGYEARLNVYGSALELLGQSEVKDLLDLNVMRAVEKGSAYRTEEWVTEITRHKHPAVPNDIFREALVKLANNSVDDSIRVMEIEKKIDEENIDLFNNDEPLVFERGIQRIKFDTYKEVFYGFNQGNAYKVAEDAAARCNDLLHGKNGEIGLEPRI